MEPVAIDWGYTISTLIILFIGIFVVLGLAQVIMQIMGRILIGGDVRDEVKTDGKTETDTGEIPPEQAAAIAMALYLHERNR